MRCKRLLLAVVVSGLSCMAWSQRIVYSEPDREDTRRLNFEIIGKIDGNFLIYKNVRSNYWISVLDNDMQEIAKVEQDYVPNSDRLINVDFFPYSSHAYMVYQYQKRNVVYCMAAKIDGNGRKVDSIIQLDTTHVGFAANNRIYTVITNEDKSRIGVFKINTRNKRLYVMTTLLLDDKLGLQKKSIMQIPMDDRNDHLGDFHLDNDGDLVFSKFNRSSNDHISNAFFVIKYAQADSLVYKELNIEKTWLDEIHIKVDNVNKRYFLTSFYYKEKKGNIDGLYFYVWDKFTEAPVVENISIFSDELKKEARGEASTRMAFNDYFIQDIITRRDGGFLIAGEAYYTTSRFNTWNRWNYLYGGSPFGSPYNYYYSPYYNRYWWNSRSFGNNQSVRYHADNIAILSFDNKGQLEWNNVIGKSQFSDESDNALSYQLMNTGGEIHFLFNHLEKRNNLLNDYTVSPRGEMTRNPTLKNLDRGHEFMPKYGKQVSARQVIVPCIIRNSVCFAKIDYN